MLGRFGDYRLRSVTRSYNGQKFNRCRVCWYDVFEADLLSANLSAEPVEGKPVEGELVGCWLDHSSFLKKQWSPLCIHLGEETCWRLH